MGIDRLKHVKDTLMCCVEGQMHKLDTVNTQELGAAIDMIKDLEEAIYYCTITEAMKEKEHHYKEEEDEEEEHKMYLDNGRKNNKTRNGRSQTSSNRGRMGEHTRRDGMTSPSENDNEMYERDEREGRSGEVRRLYMEGKESNHSSEMAMKELEHYMQELTGDIMEMIEDTSPEERQFLSKKIATLATKVGATK